jgi:hypothetical protein
VAEGHVGRGGGHKKKKQKKEEMKVEGYNGK